MRHYTSRLLAPQTTGNWSAALIAHLLLLQPQPKPSPGVFGMGGQVACDSPALESPSVSFHKQGNKYSLESGRDTKDFRTPRKPSIARAIP